MMLENSLPKVLPLMPLHGAVLLPKAYLPVPFSESEYDIFAKKVFQEYGYLGIVQPSLGEIGQSPVPLYKIGCVAKLVEHKEVEEGRIVTILEGICRFEILRELPEEGDYRRALVNYDKYSADLEEQEDFCFDRERLLSALEIYFKKMDVSLNWKEIRETSDQKLVTALAMVCPLADRERQALLETPSLKEQSKMITTLIEFSAHDPLIPSMECH